MSIQNYIIDMLELKDSNIFFKVNYHYKEVIKGVIYKIFEAIFLMLLIFILNVVLFLMINLKNMTLLFLILLFQIP